MDALKILTQAADAQHKADTLEAAQEYLADNTKVLGDDILAALVHFASKTSYASDDTLPARVAHYQFKMPQLHERITAQWNLLHSLQRQLSDLRTYLGFATPQALSEALAAGKRAPVSVTPAKPSVRINVSDTDKIKEAAIKRAQEFAEKHKKEA